MGWRHASGALALALLALGLANHDALASWARLWLYSGQEYGLVVWLIGVWLIWRTRDRLQHLTPEPDRRALLALAPVAAALWVAYLVDIRIVQFALLVACLGCLAWAMLGARALRILAFPIAYLWLALPIGNLLQSTLQGMTVRATVIALKLTGVPVYVDETFIHIPRGAIVVLERCSGAQFFQAGLTLGVLYAYLNFRVLWMRVAVLAAFIAAAVVGNWARVYALCFLPLLTDSQHFYFGWAMFGAAMLPTFWFCMRLQRREDDLIAKIATSAQSHASDLSTAARRQVSLASFGALLTAVLVLVVAPAAAVRPQLGHHSGAGLDPASAVAPWSGPFPAEAGWHAVFAGTDAQALATYRLAGRAVTAYWAYYATQTQGAEVINQLNTVYDPANWQPRGGYAGTDYRQMWTVDGREFEVIETRIENVQGGTPRLVWHWYSVGGHSVVRPWRAKLAQVLARTQGRQDAMVIALTTAGEDVVAAREVLRKFVESGAAMPRVNTGSSAAALERGRT